MGDVQFSYHCHFGDAERPGHTGKSEAPPFALSIRVIDMRPGVASRQWAWRQGAYRAVLSTLAWGLLVAIPAFAAAAGAQANPAALATLGRGSCGERVCQHV